jgi:hypothetical protein
VLLQSDALPTELNPPVHVLCVDAGAALWPVGGRDSAS